MAQNRKAAGSKKVSPTHEKVSPMQRLRKQIESMTAAELASLRSNAERWSKAVPGESAELQNRVATAWEVMSLVDAEIGQRKNRKLAPARP